MGELLTTPLNSLHKALGAKMVPFAGYDMPVQYDKGILQEHQHTRTQASIFDVSHMGQILLSGAGISEALEKILPIAVKELAPARQRYGFFTLENGGILDDVMLTKIDEQHFYLVVNASRINEDWHHLQTHLGGFHLEKLTNQALIAIQGPKAVEVLATQVPECQAMKFMDSQAMTWQQSPIRVSRSGYTGEDGFEVSLPAEQADAFVRALLAHDSAEMAGLGARDSLRMEAGLCLYGNDIDETTTPIAAGLKWAIQPVRRAGGARAGGFIGDHVILAELVNGTEQQLTGFVVSGKAPVRAGADLVDENGHVVGKVTSGCYAASVESPIVLGYVDTLFLEEAQPIFAAVRQKMIPLNKHSLPFVPNRYQR